MYLALVYTDCVHIFLIIACSKGLSVKKPDSQECHVVFQNNTNNQIPSGYAKERVQNEGGGIKSVLEELPQRRRR